MNRILIDWMFRPMGLRFTANPRHVMDELLFGGAGLGRTSRSSVLQLVPCLALAGDELAGYEAQQTPDKLPTPLDVPVPEPHDVPAPSPQDVPPPEPHDVPPPKPGPPSSDPPAKPPTSK